MKFHVSFSFLVVLKLWRFWILQLSPTSSEVMHTFTSRKRLNSEDHCIDVSIESKKAKIMENFSALTPKNGLNPKPSGAGGGGAKKLVIKNLKAKPTLPDNFQVYLSDKITKKNFFYLISFSVKSKCNSAKQYRTIAFSRIFIQFSFDEFFRQIKVFFS